MDPGLRQNDVQRTSKEKVRTMFLLVIPAQAGIHRRR
jgi:hypothetical protein